MLFTALLGFTTVFHSCNKDDDSLDRNGTGNEEIDNGNEGSNQNNGEGNSDSSLPKESRIFLGYWKNSLFSNQSWACNFLFFEDGSCGRLTPYKYKRDKGYWNYNPKTSILTTTTGGWSWTVTLSNEYAWIGTSIGTNERTCNFSKASNLEYIKEFLYYFKWITDDGKTFYYDLNRKRWEGDFFPKGTSFYIYEDDNENDFTFKIKQDDIILGTITLANPYNPEKSILTIKNAQLKVDKSSLLP